MDKSGVKNIETKTTEQLTSIEMMTIMITLHKKEIDILRKYILGVHACSLFSVEGLFQCVTIRYQGLGCVMQSFLQVELSGRPPQNLQWT